jgi:hypothetical protein
MKRKRLKRPEENLVKEELKKIFNKRKLQMNSERTLELTISRDNIISQVASFLYALGVIKESEEITDIKFGSALMAYNKQEIPIKVKFKEGVHVLKFNGKSNKKT